LTRAFGGEDLALMQPLAGVSLPILARAGAAKFPEAMLFTHRGLSGPAILQISSYWHPGEAITLDRLRDLNAVLSRVDDAVLREHLSYAFFRHPAPSAPDGLWTVDTPEQLAAMDRLLTITTAALPDFMQGTA
jgi:predicted flavoprotein YhiN